MKGKYEKAKGERGGEERAKLRAGFRIRIRIRTDPHVFALPGSGQKGKEMNE